MLPFSASVVAIIAVLFSALICQWISIKRGNTSLWWGLLGLCLGPLVVPFALLLAGKSQRQKSHQSAHFARGSSS